MVAGRETPAFYSNNRDYNFYLLEIRWAIFAGKMYFSNIALFAIFNMYLFEKKIIMIIYGTINCGTSEFYKPFPRAH